jgi:hypothetical protein
MAQATAPILDSTETDLAAVIKRIPGDQPFAWPKAEEASHAVREYLVAMGKDSFSIRPIPTRW